MTATLEDNVRSWAAAVGFDQVGIARVDDVPTAIGLRLKAFLAEGRHGDMDWLAGHEDRRSHPLTLWPQAKSAIMLGMSYAPEDDPLAILQQTDRGAISVYARGRDYHDVVKPKLKAVARQVARATSADVKVFIDTAPLMEKPLAALAGLGWQGRHTNLVSRQNGSWLFLGAILTSADLQSGRAEIDRCGSCRRCLDICPTAAFPAPYQLDARRCISYLTIEHKGPIDRELRPLMGNRIYGCDDCLAVCPWNKFAAAGREQRFQARAETDNPPLHDLLGLDDAAFRQRFAGTPVKRTGRDRFLRNVLIAVGNSGNRGYLGAVRTLIEDPSPLVRGAAVWAASRLCDGDEWTALVLCHAQTELEPAVIVEWREGQAA